MKIRQALRAKKLKYDSIDAALQGVDDNIYEEQAKRLLAAKSRQLAHDGQRWAKLMRYMTGRGFETERIARLLAQNGEKDTDGWDF